MPPTPRSTAGSMPRAIAVPAESERGSVTGLCFSQRNRSASDAAAGRFPERIPQPALEYLATFFPRQRVLKADVAWNFVFRDARHKKCADVTGADRGARRCFDHGHQCLAEIVVGYSKHRAVSDTGTLHQRLLDFRGIDIDTAADDHVRTAIAKIQTVVLQVSDIADADEAVAFDLPALFILTEIGEIRQGRLAHENIADLA